MFLLQLTNSALLEKPPVPLLLKNFPIFDGTQRFIILFTRALQFSLPGPDKFNPQHPILFI
jgi:hypothetical protein